MTRTRDQAEELAWRPWRLLSEGRREEALALLDDAGIWWEMATRTAHPMTTMKGFLDETFGMFPMTFRLVGSVVEADNVVLMVESNADLPDGVVYNNVYAFVNTLHPSANLISHVREYVDTHHANQTLLRAMIDASKASGQPSPLTRLFG